MGIKEVRFQYDGIDITFTKGEDVMVNATEMAMVFGKRPAKWLELPSTKTYLKAMSEKRTLADDEVVTTVRGTDNPGTWMHQKVALRFAQWLSVDFSLWVDDRIEELITVGVTATTPDDLLDPDMMIRAMNELKESRAREAEANAKLEVQKPKIECFERLIESTGLLSMGEASKAVGVGRTKMMQRLRDVGVFTKNRYQNNVPYQKYIDAGYFKVKTFTRQNRTTVTPLCTPKGVDFIRKKISNEK